MPAVMVNINEALSHLEEWADALLTGNLCVLSGGVVNGSFILVPEDRGILPVACGLLLGAVGSSLSSLSPGFWA